MFSVVVTNGAGVVNGGGGGATRADGVEVAMGDGSRLESASTSITSSDSGRCFFWRSFCCSLSLADDIRALNESRFNELLLTFATKTFVSKSRSTMPILNAESTSSKQLYLAYAHGCRTACVRARLLFFNLRALVSRTFSLTWPR